ncbi:unnamed protein product, partial [Ascophyllum nodosum]
QGRILAQVSLIEFSHVGLGEVGVLDIGIREASAGDDRVLEDRALSRMVVCTKREMKNVTTSTELYTACNAYCCEEEKKRGIALDETRNTSSSTRQRSSCWIFSPIAQFAFLPLLRRRPGRGAHCLRHSLDQSLARYFTFIE